MLLTNRVALITGAGGGLGHAIAEAFTREGATVLIHDLRPEARVIAEQLGGDFHSSRSHQPSRRTRSGDPGACAIRLCGHTREQRRLSAY